MVLRLIAGTAVCAALATAAAATSGTGNLRAEERTSFQSADPFSPPVDIRSDVAMVYGVNASLTSRVAEWKRQGYIAHLMTGASWGQYEEYINGSFDGKKHDDEGQVDPQGNVIWHHPGVPYMIPSQTFIDYLKHLVRQGIDAGVEAVHLEEPEIWSRSGYSEGFKRLWVAEYNEPWRRPDSGPDAFWRSSKLKYVLYKRALEQVFAEAKTYGKTKGRDIKCYVPTHSLVNYSQWKIVSPESSLMDLSNCDGYIAQVWTGTARTPNIYRGARRERTFETAFLEYSSMYHMVAPTGRRVYFLADPVEDDPKHTWDDYRHNYRRTVAASLMFPQVHHFEVMPWPDRVMTHRYPAGSFAAGDEQTTIPAAYAAELMTVVNALNDMKQDHVRMEAAADDVAVMVSDTMMFQRGNDWGANGPLEFSGFYGLAMPLIKNGVPVKCLVMEQCLNKDFFAGVKTLVMSYEALKPLKPEYHARLAEWVRGGGHLVYAGLETDPFHHVREWWNEDGKTSRTARLHLREALGLSQDDMPLHRAEVGSGEVSFITSGPVEMADAPDGHRRMLDAVGVSTESKPHLLLERGPYVVGFVPDEGETSQTLKIEGVFIDLFSEDQRVVTDPLMKPGEVFLLRRMVGAATGLGRPEPLAGTVRVEERAMAGGTETWQVRGPSVLTTHTLLLSCPARPTAIEINGQPVTDYQWNAEQNMARLSIPYRPQMSISIRQK